MLTVNKLDASYKFMQAIMENIEANGLESTMTQFRAIANSYATDFFIDVTAQPTQGLEN